MRSEILKADSMIKQENHQNKMRDLDDRIKQLEKIQNEREEKKRQEEEEERQRLQQRDKGNKNFLGNIKSYSIDDI